MAEDSLELSWPVRFMFQRQRDVNVHLHLTVVVLDFNIEEKSSLFLSVSVIVPLVHYSVRVAYRSHKELALIRD